MTRDGHCVGLAWEGGAGVGGRERKGEEQWLKLLRRGKGG